CGLPAKDEALVKGLAALAKLKPDGKPLPADARLHFFYGHLYAAQAHWAAGDRAWYPAIRDELLRKVPDGFRVDDHWGQIEFGRDYATAMALNILLIPRADKMQAK